MSRTATTQQPTAFASASNVSTADELLGRLIACRPIEDRMFDTKVGSSTATVCQLVTVDDDGTPDDLGERPIFWQVVRRQLTAATKATPWIAGRLVQAGQAYKLDSLTDHDAGLVARALASLPTGDPAS